MRESFKEYFALKKVPDYDYDYDDFIKYCGSQHPNVPGLIKKYGNPYEVEGSDLLTQKRRRSRRSFRRKSRLTSLRREPE